MVRRLFFFLLAGRGGREEYYLAILNTLKSPGIANNFTDDIDGAGSPWFIANACRRAAEEYAEGLARRPVSQLTNLEFFAGIGLAFGRQGDVKIDLISPRVGSPIERQRICDKPGSR